MPFKIHPDTPAPDTIREAVARLYPQARARWGTLNATGMLEHVARFHEIYLGRRSAPWPVRVLARLIGRPMVGRFLATSPFKMRRGMRTLPGLRVDVREVQAESFETERARMLETFDEIHALVGEVVHPLYGRIDADVVKALTRHHAAHHLSQFGLLESGDPEGGKGRPREHDRVVGPHPRRATPAQGFRRSPTRHQSREALSVFEPWSVRP